MKAVKEALTLLATIGALVALLIVADALVH